jgi:hypothetical protein
VSDAYDGLRHCTETWVDMPDACEAPCGLSPAPPDARTREATRFDLATIATCLPRLGPVLWLERHPLHALPTRPSFDTHDGVLFGHPALAMLGRCESVTARFAVTAHGPREWLDFRDANASVEARLFLLPDTDYFAWDRMLEGCARPPLPRRPQPWHAHAAFLRGALARIGRSWRAHLVTFRFERIQFLSLLDARTPARISPLGLELARPIADGERAELRHRQGMP